MSDPRPRDQLRPVTVQRGFTKTAAGSVLWRQGGTVVLCTAAVEVKRPRFFSDDRAGGWVTAEYVMHPASVKGRKDWPGLKADKRGIEIGRLIGRSLRAAVDETKLGPHTITVDCTVLEADGGTRTASICGGMIALRDALASLPSEMPGARDEHNVAPAYDQKLYQPSKAIVADVAAVSVGICDGQPTLDLDYILDSSAETDLNVVKTSAGNYVEIQGTAESGTGFTPEQLTQMLNLADSGLAKLFAVQRDG
ncbi:MAG: ribonuclease PH [Planctomycetota bacterium]